jgi:hypothetical protein
MIKLHQRELAAAFHYDAKRLAARPDPTACRDGLWLDDLMKIHVV